MAGCDVQDEMLAQTRTSRAELIDKVREIMSGAANPAEELIATGEALARIGRALQSLTTQEAKRVLRAVIALES